MTNTLYITADKVGLQSGGGRVTQEESTALFDWTVERDGDGRGFQCWGRDDLQKGMSGPLVDDPYWWDKQGMELLGTVDKHPPQLAHFYAGTFSTTINLLKARGCRITYTAAAHDVSLSRREHERLGIPYNYPHLTDPALWERYLAGYKAADVLVCPSQHSADVMRGFGCTQRIEVIPHGVYLPAEVKPPPQRFTVGYLGAVGPDKGLIYLLQAWNKLAYSDAVLVLAGRDSTSHFVMNLVAQCIDGRVDLVMECDDVNSPKKLHRLLVEAKNGTKVMLSGWIPNVSDFYNQISLYVQPSVTEGFGIEVLEALAHGRPVLCSTGAGAADVVQNDHWRFPACDVVALADKIDEVRERHEDSHLAHIATQWARRAAEEYTWQKVRKRYQNLWSELV